MRLGAADKKLDDRSTVMDFMAAAEIQDRVQVSLENLDLLNNQIEILELKKTKS